MSVPASPSDAHESFHPFRAALIPGAAFLLSSSLSKTTFGKTMNETEIQDGRFNTKCPLFCLMIAERRKDTG